MPGRPIVEIGSENWFAAGATISTANATSLQTTQFQKRVTNSLQTIQLRQRITLSL
jgi:hypothetical protein